MSETKLLQEEAGDDLEKANTENVEKVGGAIVKKHETTEMIIEQTNNSITIQLQYCFEDENLHSINAEILNDCEKQFICAIKSTEKYLEDTLSINIHSREKGSFIDIFTITMNNPIFASVLAGFITHFVVKFFGPIFASAKDEIDETSKKLDTVLKIKEEIKKGTLTEEDFDYIASNNKELLKRKSNFFKTVAKEQKITKIEASTIADTNSKPIVVVANREDFKNFILPDIPEKREGTQQVKIYIVAPILVKGRNYSWKGLLNDEPIEFKVTDKEFLDQVYTHNIKFSNGSYINCNISTIKLVDLHDEKTKVSRTVYEVIDCGDGDSVKQIPKRKKVSTQNETVQPSLFDGIDLNVM